MSETIRLPHKPDSPLSYRFLPGQGPLSTTHIVVFLNGLIMPQTGWLPTIEDLQRRWAESGEAKNYPSLLTYDRFGQGESARDPADELHGGHHGVVDVIADLSTLIYEVWRTRAQGAASDQQPGQTGTAGKRLPRLILVGNSIGCVLARLFDGADPGRMDALLLLDSNIANSDLVSIFPDPDARGFDPAALPAGATVGDLRRARAGYASHFHPSAPNPEHLDRRDIAGLLPRSDAPALEAAPRVTVVGHDWEAFAEEGSRGSMNVPKSLTNAFVNPAWSRYNDGLARLTDADRARGPVIAVGCGHFIQKDDPAFVAELVEDLLQKVGADAA
ncbi:alpha/beta-hydrolase [Jackrogersella minutella]|nr:alpha/beta-hydrolase [Jackrogersella minutella]